MRILIALTYYRPHYSGLTIYAEREARALAALGHDVTILTSQYEKHLPEEETIDGVTIKRLKVRLRISKGVIMPSMPYWAIKLIRQSDVVQVHVPQFDAALIALLGRIFKKPVVLTYHCDLKLPSGFIHFVANKVSNFTNHLTALSANAIVHNSIDYAENSPFLRHYLEKVKPIYPPVVIKDINNHDLLAFRNKLKIQPNQRLIGMAARLATEKGVKFLAEALFHILEEIPDARVLFVGPYQQVLGEEEYSRQLTPMINKLGDHWTYLGILTENEMAAFFHECEVTVLPSINSTESFGIVQVESMSCGTPVIASNLPGVRVPVSITNMGLIVTPEDSRELAEAIITVLHDINTFHGNAEKLLSQSTPAGQVV